MSKDNPSVNFEDDNLVIDECLPEGEGGDQGHAVAQGELDEAEPLLQDQVDLMLGTSNKIFSMK